MSAGPRLRILLRADREGAGPLASALEAAGHEVITAADDTDMAARLKEAAADLVLLEAGDAGLAKLQEALAENDRLREAVGYARTTAHDLAQPLTTIMARSQLLLTKTKPEDPSHKALKVISDEAGRLADLIVKFQKLKEMSR